MLRTKRVAAGFLGFDAYDEVDGPMDTPCWLYHKRPTNTGYAQMKMPDGTQPNAHRAFYELHVGVIPEGLTLDHLCRVRRCVNPAHLEPVTRGVNTLRGETLSAANKAKTQCMRGHLFDVGNTRITKEGTRACRHCDRDRARQLRGAKGAAARDALAAIRDARHREVQALWHAGLTRHEIAARMGTTEPTVKRCLDRLRAKGYDLPKRPPGGQR